MAMGLLQPLLSLAVHFDSTGLAFTDERGCISCLLQPIRFRFLYKPLQKEKIWIEQLFCVNEALVKYRDRDSKIGQV